MDFADTRVSLSGNGVMTGIAASTVTAGAMSVTVAETTITALVARGLAPAVGDLVLIARQGSIRWVVQIMLPTAPASQLNDGSPTTKPPVTNGSLTCSPGSTGSYRGGKWRTDTDDILQGDYGGFGINTGAAFYGTKPASLAGATATGASVLVKRITGGSGASQAPTLRLVTQTTRPAGAPTLTSTTAGPSLAVNKAVSIAVPTAWAQAMIDGTAGGLAIDTGGSASPYIRTAGRSTYSPSWTLTINWKR